MKIIDNVNSLLGDDLKGSLAKGSKLKISAYGLHTRTHPLPLDRLARLDVAMGLRFENMPDLVENTAAFVAIRNPAPPPAPAPAPPRPVRKRRP